MHRSRDEIFEYWVGRVCYCGPVSCRRITSYSRREVRTPIVLPSGDQ